MRVRNFIAVINFFKFGLKSVIININTYIIYTHITCTRILNYILLNRVGLVTQNDQNIMCIVLDLFAKEWLHVLNYFIHFMFSYLVLSWNASLFRFFRKVLILDNALQPKVKTFKLWISIYLMSTNELYGTNRAK